MFAAFLYDEGIVLINSSGMPESTQTPAQLAISQRQTEFTEQLIGLYSLLKGIMDNKNTFPTDDLYISIPLSSWNDLEIAYESLVAMDRLSVPPSDRTHHK